MRTLIGVDDPITVRERRRYLLRHTFSGASLTPSDLGPNLTTSIGTPVVSGGTLSKSGVGNLVVGTGTAGAPISLGASNIVAQCRMNFGDSAATDRRVLLKCRSDINGNVIEFGIHRLVGGGTGVQIGSRASGSLTVIGFQSATIADSTWYVFQARLFGTSLRALLGPDGGLLTEYLAATSGLYLSQAAIEAAIIDANSTIQLSELEVWRAP